MFTSLTPFKPLTLTCIILLFLPCKSGEYLKQFRCTNHLGSFTCLKQTMCQQFKINRLQLSLIKTEVEELIYLTVMDEIIKIENYS